MKVEVTFPEDDRIADVEQYTDIVTVNRGRNNGYAKLFLHDSNGGEITLSAESHDQMVINQIKF